MKVWFPYPPYNKDSYLIDGFSISGADIFVVSVNGNQIELSEPVSMPAGQLVKFQK
jgi:hypothetical protein